jgi:hypothetical protein
MTAETAPQPERQVRAQGGSRKMVGYGVVVAAVPYMLLHDRRLHVAVITGAIGAVALAEVIKNNEARPVRRAASWYWKAGTGRKLARAGRALEAGKRG